MLQFCGPACLFSRGCREVSKVFSSANTEDFAMGDRDAEARRGRRNRMCRCCVQWPGSVQSVSGCDLSAAVRCRADAERLSGYPASGRRCCSLDFLHDCCISAGVVFCVVEWHVCASVFPSWRRKNVSTPNVCEPYVRERGAFTFLDVGVSLRDVPQHVRDVAKHSKKWRFSSTSSCQHTFKLERAEPLTFVNFF